MDISFEIRYNEENSMGGMMKIKNTDLEIIVKPALEWFAAHKRDLPWRHDPTPYRVWVSEIMLQQTRVESVIPYYLRFMQEVPDVNTLARIPQDRLMKLWEGLGYYSRVRNLQKAAKIICDRKAFPTDYKGWLELPGIGEYTAGAVCSIAFGLPTPAVDGNVLRVLSRVLASRADITALSTKKKFREALRRVYPQDASSFTQSLMEIGALICLPNGEPKCALCPFAFFCGAKKENVIDRIPVKPEKKARKIVKKTVLMIRCGEQIALRRRPASGLLAGLWEFPNKEGYLTPKAIEEDFCGNLICLDRLSDAEHIFTHVEWHMRGYFLALKEKDQRFQWFSTEEILSRKAIPGAFKSFMDSLYDLRWKNENNG